MKTIFHPGAIRKLGLMAAVALTAFGGFADTYYVDAEQGDDANPGTSPGKGGARQPLVGIFGVAKSEGDVVYAAEGVYSNKCEVFNTQNFRAVVPAGVKLIASGRVAKTVILGEGDTETGTAANNFMGPKAVRGVRLGAGATLKGFTITGGRLTNNTDEPGRGGGVSCASANTWVIGCTITNNVGTRGGGVSGGTSIRCVMRDNGGSPTDIFAGKAFNCLFGDSSSQNVYHGGPFVNCTFYGTGSSVNGNVPVTFYNCALLKNAVGNDPTLETCAKGSSASTLGMDDAYRPLRTSETLVGQGNATNYSTHFPSDVADEANLDLQGLPRMRVDKIDIGAFASPAGIGETVDWYVDAVDGDDGNTGFGADHPVRTLAAAMSGQMASGDVVHAAAGVYSDGATAVTIGSVSRLFRVVVPAGVTLKADAPETFIIGAGDTVNGSAETYYCGPAAVAGVYLAANAQLRGFTLTGCHSDAFNGDSYGGAVYADGLSPLVADCTITNNVAGRAAGVRTGTSIRCRFNDNRSVGTGCDVMQGRAFNCLFGNLPNANDHNVYQTGPYVNCTFYGTGKVVNGNDNSMIANSIVLKPFVGKEPGYPGCLVDTSAQALENLGLDADYRPKRRSRPFNAATKSLYEDNFPAAFAIEKGLDLDGNDRFRDGGLDIGCYESDSPARVNFYVNGTTGNDGYDGLSPDKAFLTLRKALTHPEVLSNDVVHVSGGIAPADPMTDAAGLGYRVIVPSYVTLVAAEGECHPVLAGAEDRVTGTEETHYCGPAAVRCAKLNAGSVLQGFTLTGGHTHGYDNAAEHWGGAVNGVGGSVVDCIVTNNVAAFAAGVRGAVCIRCRFEDNDSLATGCDLMGGSAFNCLFGNMRNASAQNVYQTPMCVNCTFYGNGSCANGNAAITMYNCIVLKGHVGASPTWVSSLYNTTRESAGLDEDYRPLLTSPAVDEASREDYDRLFPSALAGEKGVCLLNGQRVYNAELDIGAFEFDYRETFAKTLKKSRLAVVSASEDVSLGDGQVLVPDGCEIRLTATPSVAAPCTFSIAAEEGGVATVVANGEVLPAGADGRYAFECRKGDNAVSIAYAGEGNAAVSCFRYGIGSLLLVR